MNTQTQIIQTWKSWIKLLISDIGSFESTIHYDHNYSVSVEDKNTGAQLKFKRVDGHTWGIELCYLDQKRLNPWIRQETRQWITQKTSETENTEKVCAKISIAHVKLFPALRKKVIRTFKKDFAAYTKKLAEDQAREDVCYAPVFEQMKMIQNRL